LLWLDRAHATVGHGELACERRDLLSHGLRFVGPEVSAPPIELVVARDELRRVLGKMLEEVLAGAGAEEEQVRPDPGSPCCAGGLDDFGELLGPIGDPGKIGARPVY
jgi:hypothetical protein